MEPGPVRDGLWVCGDCKGTNTVANSPCQCPVCNHWRDYQIGCCTNPGEYVNYANFFADHLEYQDSNDIYSQETSHFDRSIPGTGHHLHGTVDQPIHVPQSFNDIWTCCACGADNLEWCDEQCPVCGAMRDNSSDRVTSSEPTFRPGAGSPAAGVWTCSNCNGSNSEFHWPQCGQCGHMN
jgi:hypothetical protein